MNGVISSSVDEIERLKKELQRIPSMQGLELASRVSTKKPYFFGNSDSNIKIAAIKKSIFAIVKSGTVSLEVCKYGVPSIIIYKMNFLNFFIAKLFLKIKYANMINIINNKEIIPELLQKECNSDEIYKTVNYLLKKPEIINEQLKQVNKTINELRSNTSSSNEASSVLLSYLR